MKFWLSPAFCDTAHLVGLAKAAEEHGYEGIAIPDHLFHPVELSSPYPYTPDGTRFWTQDTPWADPLVAATHMAAATQTLRFYTSVLKLGSRNPVLLAKAWGMTKDQALRPIYSALLNAGVETISLIDRVAGDVFKRWG